MSSKTPCKKGVSDQNEDVKFDVFCGERISFPVQQLVLQKTDQGKPFLA